MFPGQEIFCAPAFKFLREGSQNTFLNTKKNPQNFWYFLFFMSLTELLSLYPGIKSVQMIILLFLITANNSN